MWFWVIQIIVFSVILIALVHHLFHFFKTTLTVPKIKNLVNSPAQKYQHMYDIIQQHQPPTPPPDADYSLIDMLPTTDMKSELKDFLKSQLRD